MPASLNAINVDYLIPLVDICELFINIIIENCFCCIELRMFIQISPRGEM